MNKASIGRIVIVHTPTAFNGSHFHPGIITAAWNDTMVNVKVFPDCGAPYDETSINLHETPEEGAAGPSPTRFAHWPVIPFSGGGPGPK